MTDFTITEDFPKNQIEFDTRFNSEQACQDYLFKMKWVDGFECRECQYKEYGVLSPNPRNFRHPKSESGKNRGRSCHWPRSSPGTFHSPNYFLSNSSLTASPIFSKV